MHWRRKQGGSVEAMLCHAKHSVRMRRAYVCTGRMIHIYIYIYIYIGASVSEPHTSEFNGGISLIAASAASPTLVVKYTYTYIFIYLYIYGTCVFRTSILPYLCVMQYFHIAHWFM